MPPKKTKKQEDDKKPAAKKAKASSATEHVQNVFDDTKVTYGMYEYYWKYVYNSS